MTCSLDGARAPPPPAARPPAPTPNCRWAGLLNGQAYQNYPSVYYQPPERGLAMYYGANLCQLAAAQRRYDPGGVFAASEGRVPWGVAGCE